MTESRGKTMKTPRLTPRRPHTLALSLVLALATAATATAQTKKSVPDELSPPPDAIKTPSGLASKVLKAGTGNIYADDNDRVAVHFVGWTPQGAEFQSTFGQEKPAVFELQSVFPGWIEAMQMMVTGEERRFWIA